MTTANHASAGTQVYGYNHANQRAQTSRCGSVRNGTTVTDDPEGLGGERLMEFEESCTSGACTSYTETQRWIYFAGRKMFSGIRYSFVLIKSVVLPPTRSRRSGKISPVLG